MSEIYATPNQTASQWRERNAQAEMKKAMENIASLPAPAALPGQVPGANAVANAQTLRELAQHAHSEGHVALAQSLEAKAVEAGSGQAMLTMPSMGAGVGTGVGGTHFGQTYLPPNGGGGGMSGMMGNPMGNALSGNPISAENFGGGGYSPAMAPPHAIDLNEPLYKSMAKKSMAADKTPYKFSESLHYLGAYTGIEDPAEATRATFQFLRRLGDTPAVSPIVNNLVKRSHAYAKRPRGWNDTGWEIRMKSRSASLTTGARKRIEEIESIIHHGGYKRDPLTGDLREHPETGEPGVWDGNGKEKAMPFREFLSCAMRDSMTMDWFCFRMEPDANSPKKHPVVFFSPTDSAQIRRVHADHYTNQILPAKDKALYVEMAPQGIGLGGNEVMREFTWDKLHTVVRNPRVGFFGRGYGNSELEMALDVIAADLMGYNHIRSWWDENNIPPGIVNVRGNLQGEQSYSVLRQQLSQMGGPNAFWKLLYMFQSPIPNADQSVQFIPLRSATGGLSEMQFSMQAITMFFNLVCAIVGISPEEVGMQGYANTPIGVGAGDPQAKLENSRDRCFVPMMETIAIAINEALVERIDPDFEFRWVNLQTDAQGVEDQHIQALMGRGYTPNMIADELDEPRFKHPVDPVLYGKVKAKVEEEDYESHSEYMEAVHETYEATCEKKGMLQAWSVAWDAPVGNGSQMAIWTAEQEQLQAQVAQKADEKQQKEQRDEMLKAFGIDGKDPLADIKTQLAQLQLQQGILPDVADLKPGETFAQPIPHGMSKEQVEQMQGGGGAPEGAPQGGGQEGAPPEGEASQGEAGPEIPPELAQELQAMGVDPSQMSPQDLQGLMQEMEQQAQGGAPQGVEQGQAPPPPVEQGSAPAPVPTQPQGQEAAPVADEFMAAFQNAMKGKV